MLLYTWKYHKETPCVAILNKSVIFFFFYKIIDQKGGKGPVWGLATVGGGGYEERV
jgi:hypothetical protein